MVFNISYTVRKHFHSFDVDFNWTIVVITSGSIRQDFIVLVNREWKEIYAIGICMILLKNISIFNEKIRRGITIDV